MFATVQLQFGDSRHSKKLDLAAAELEEHRDNNPVAYLQLGANHQVALMRY